MVVFMIVGKSDPLFELEVIQSNSSSGGGLDDGGYLNQFILYSSIDMINSVMWSNSNIFLKVVDKFNFQLVSAYTTQGGKTLLLLHNGKSEDAVRSFFIDVHEIYVKYLMNPFSEPDSPIISPQFNSYVKALVKRHLT